MDAFSGTRARNNHYVESPFRGAVERRARAAGLLAAPLERLRAAAARALDDDGRVEVRACEALSRGSLGPGRGAAPTSAVGVRGGKTRGAGGAFAAAAASP